MTVQIHPTAIVEDGAILGEDVIIGPYCTVGPHVKIGDRTSLKSHVVVDGFTTIGDDNKIFPFATLGLEPQHMRYEGEESTLVIGDRNLIREYVCMHPGTNVGIMTTVVGDDNMFLIHAHVGHDAVLGNNIIMVNSSMVGGHAVIGNHVYLAASSAVKPFVRIGDQAMIWALSAVVADVIPYGTVSGSPGDLIGLNLIGLKRRGFTKEQIQIIRRAYRLLFAMEGTFAERLEEVEHLYGNEDLVRVMLQFIKDGGDQPLSHPARV